jgi:hypothetical protein
MVQTHCVGLVGVGPVPISRCPGGDIVAFVDLYRQRQWACLSVLSHGRVPLI